MKIYVNLPRSWDAFNICCINSFSYQRLHIPVAFLFLSSLLFLGLPWVFFFNKILSLASVSSINHCYYIGAALLMQWSNVRWRGGVLFYTLIIKNLVVCLCPWTVTFISVLFPVQGLVKESPPLLLSVATTFSIFLKHSLWLSIYLYPLRFVGLLEGNKIGKNYLSPSV